MLGSITWITSSREINTGTWTRRLGKSHEIETMKYAHESRGTPRQRLR
jgi:hypothetical protein